MVHDSLAPNTAQNSFHAALHLLGLLFAPFPYAKSAIIAGADNLGPVESYGMYDTRVSSKSHGALPRRQVGHSNPSVGATRYYLVGGVAEFGE